MNTIFFFIATIAVVFAIDVHHNNRPVINQELIDTINRANGPFKAGRNEFLDRFETLEDIKYLLGYKEGARLPQKEIEVGALPTQFSSATEWKNCSSITAIQNQARCGSCWAFGGVEAMTDRWCIGKKEQQNPQLSFQDVTSCDQNSNGCEGGSPGSTWEFAVNQGIVTAKCDPYTVPTCTPQEQPCLNFVPTPPCVQKCTDGETWTTSKHFYQNAYQVGPAAPAIQQEIQEHGPVEACFSVYEDFLHYKSGVYVHKSGAYLGGHCIKIIGWGVEGGLPYWEVNNSWTTYWGNKGTFRILRGQNEVGIEGDVVAGEPKLN